MYNRKFFPPKWVITLKETNIGQIVKDDIYLDRLGESLKFHLLQCPVKLSMYYSGNNLHFEHYKDGNKDSLILNLKDKFDPSWVSALFDNSFRHIYPSFTVTNEDGSFNEIEEYLQIDKEDSELSWKSIISSKDNLSKVLKGEKKSRYVSHKIIFDRVYLREDKFRIQVLSKMENGTFTVNHYYMSSVKYCMASEFLYELKNNFYSELNTDDKNELLSNLFLTKSEMLKVIEKKQLEIFDPELFYNYFAEQICIDSLYTEKSFDTYYENTQDSDFLKNKLKNQWSSLKSEVNKNITNSEYLKKLNQFWN